ncbi:Phosphatidylethanolamine N-methyltransferase [Reticulomyxa filosa]|uniref:Phosphatidylethanolamine N-methyltransferase n=1 Tax=Reticulomyxa filosa TaxID=46433 RepID=X6NC55_RETFI|nr:Phosphatidylethanolamine N-methyltransferase [Reticulomyxa filosa]|eukprot:ETO22877.1 Phosphatidylethanolamine N-methyltransferase [Reticulomyxa filosa]
MSQPTLSKAISRGLGFGMAFTGGLWVFITWQRRKHAKNESSSPGFWNHTSSISPYQSERKSTSSIGSIAAVAMGTHNLSIPTELPTEDARMKIFDQLSEIYDSSLQVDEFFLRMGKNRQFLIRKAKGLVLEIACGTGRNLNYYNEATVSEVHFIDKSPEMMHRLKNKPISHKKIFRSFTVGDVNDLKFKDDSFDTVVDTFGLCSFEFPEKALNEMIRVTKPGGQILLLEHGVGRWRVVRWWQKRHLHQHVYSWGCYFNRDILSFIENRADVSVTDIKRKHFGTTYLIQLTKNKQPLQTTPSEVS